MSLKQLSPETLVNVLARAQNEGFIGKTEAQQIFRDATGLDSPKRPVLHEDGEHHWVKVENDRGEVVCLFCKRVLDDESWCRLQTGEFNSISLLCPC